jgi:hypothetical protein
MRDDLRIDPIDSDEGKYLIAFYSLSVYRSQKMRAAQLERLSMFPL